MSSASAPAGKGTIAAMAGMVLLMAVVSLAFFGPFLNNFFMADDLFLLERMIQGPRTILFGYGNNLRMLPSIAWRLLMTVSDLSPFGYNLFGMLLYFFNGLLVYLLLGRLLKDRLLVALAACFFIAGSVGADAVFWRAANSTLICLFFYLLTLLAYLRYRTGFQRKYLFLSLALYLCAMISKEEAASLPFILILLELLVLDGKPAVRQIALRAMPYVAVIVTYLLTNFVVIYLVFQTKSEVSGTLHLRPLYSLLAGWTVFFIGPKGRLTMDNPMIYVTALGCLSSFFLIRDKRTLLFGYGWIVCSFLPQSLSGQSQFRGDMLVNSLSRHLYLPSIGASLVLALLLVSLRDRVSLRVFSAVCIVVLSLYGWMNYGRVQERGRLWQREGEHVARFVREMKRILPEIHENSYINVTNPPEGRAFIQAAFRAFYRNPKIYWKDEYAELKTIPPDAYGIYIYYDWVKNWQQGKPGQVFMVRAPAAGSQR